MIKLGEKVRDVVTGFEGIVTGRCEYLNGCVQYYVAPKAKAGKMRDGHWIDEKQLQVVGAGVSISSAKTGGPMPNAPLGR